VNKLKVQSVLRLAVLSVVAAIVAACTTPRYAYHSVYKLTGCGKRLNREAVAESLVRRGYLHSSDRKGPYDIYHRPDIIKKGPLAQEPYEDRAGDMAVAVCSGMTENYVLTEEWRSCKDRKDCTAEDQRVIRKLADDWSCQVSEKSAHSKSWNLEDRQDWTKDSCSFIATNLEF
jgi:hypothetical protein